MADISKITALDGVTYNLKDTSKLEKTTFEYNKEIAFSSTGKLCIGKFPCYDTNVSIIVKSTTSITYFCIAILATQNINTSGGGTYIWKTYGDADNNVTPNLYAKYVSGSRYIEIYFSPEPYSKNLIHIQAMNLMGTPTNICENVSSIPSDATIKPTNTFGTNPKFTDTTYKSKTAASGGTAVSLVTTGEKYTWNSKQPALVSGTNIKTVNGNSLLGSGNIAIEFVPVNVTLASSSWDSDTKVYTISNSKVTANSLQVVTPAIGITDTQLRALQNANIQDYGQDDGHMYLKAYGSLPSIDVPITVIFFPMISA